jgi:transposase InsO family protein
MSVLSTAASLTMQAVLLSARWAGRRRCLCLEKAAGIADHSRRAELEARILLLEDALALRDAHIEVLEGRLGRRRARRPYEPTERLRILWLCEYFQISRRRLRETLGVSRSSVHRWLRALHKGILGHRLRREPANRTPNRIVKLVWEVFDQNPAWGRHRIAMTLWALGVFVSPSTVRNLLLKPRPERPSGAVASARKRRRGPVRIKAESPNQAWSLDRTRVYRWGIWPTWVLVAVDHFSRKVMCVSPLYGSDSGWVIQALEAAFARCGPPTDVISDRDPVFTCQAFRDLLPQWGVRQRFGRLGRHGSIAVTERAILTLKSEWLGRAALVRGADHLDRLLRDFATYYNGYRPHMTLGGAIPEGVHTGRHRQRPERSAKTVLGPIERRHFPDVRITAFRAAA